MRRLYCSLPLYQHWCTVCPESSLSQIPPLSLGRQAALPALRQYCPGSCATTATINMRSLPAGWVLPVNSNLFKPSYFHMLMRPEDAVHALSRSPAGFCKHERSQIQWLEEKHWQRLASRSHAPHFDWTTQICQPSGKSNAEEEQADASCASYALLCV